MSLSIAIHSPKGALLVEERGSSPKVSLSAFSMSDSFCARAIELLGKSFYFGQ